MKMRRAFALAAFAAPMFVAHAPVVAAEQSAALQADDFSFNIKSGAHIYRGNVSFRRGGIRLDCDALEAYQDARGEMKRGVCSGSPGRFRRDGGDDGGELRGSARRILFDARAAEVVLEGGAELMQSGRRIRGARVTYDLKRNTVRVRGAEESGRARVLVAPRNESENKNGAAN